jgi:hypothetical protein
VKVSRPAGATGEPHSRVMRRLAHDDALVRECGFYVGGRYSAHCQKPAWYE